MGRNAQPLDILDTTIFDMNTAGGAALVPQGARVLSKCRRLTTLTRNKFWHYVFHTLLLIEAIIAFK